MNRHVCGLLVAMAWAGGFLPALIQILFIIWLPFCGPMSLTISSVIFPLLKLSCSDTCIFGLFVTANSGLRCMFIFTVLITSYVLILCSLRMHSMEGQWKDNGRITEGSLHLHLPCYCSCLILYTLYICVPSAHNHLSY